MSSTPTSRCTTRSAAARCGPGSGDGADLGSVRRGSPAHPGAMTFLEYLSIVRRRWLYLAIGLVAGVVCGILTAPGGTKPVAEFRGTHTLLVDANTQSGANLNLQQSALLATTGPVPHIVEEQLAE